jgi:membrane protein YdbS with pleckstrin-like domain
MLPDPAHRIARAAVWYWAVRNLIAVLLLAAALVIPVVLVPMSHTVRTALLGSFIGGLSLLAVVAIALPVWRYAVHRWEATDRFVLTRSGAIFRDWRIVPLHRVQTVEVSQSILERVFGVARLVIRTASYAGSTDIHGLNAQVAREVADRLTAALTSDTDDGA